MKIRNHQLVFAALLLVSSANSLAAESPKKTTSPEPYRNVLFIEAGGLSAIGSVNYQRLFTPYFSVRLGAGWPQPINLMGHFILGPGHHKLELGFGASSSLTTDQFVFVPGLSFGYRYQPIGSRLFFNTSLMLAYVPWRSVLLPPIPWVSIGIGVAF